MQALFPAEHHPDEADVLDLQEALWAEGLARAAAAFDCLIAAYAMANDAIVLHSDHDFEYIGDAVGPAFRHEYVAE
jgi:predicted nucleic acid-binding protein